MKLSKILATIVALGLLTTAPANAVSVQTNTTFKYVKVKNDLQVLGSTSLTGNQTVAGNLAVTGTTALTGVATLTAAPVLSTGTITANGDTYTIPDVGNSSFVMLAGAQAITGVKTMSGANVITHAPTGLIVQDSDATHAVTIAPGNESANRTLSIPVLGGADTMATLGTAQTFGGAKTFTLAPVLTSATLSANGDTITIEDLGNANLVQSEGAQTINGSKTFSTPLLNASIGAGAKRQVARVSLSPVTGVCADATAYRGVIAFGRAGTVTRITYGTAVDPVSGTNVITAEKNGFSGNTMLSTASVSLNGATANVAQIATLTGTGADLALAETDTVALEYNAGTQGTDAEQVWATVEFQPDDF